MINRLVSASAIAIAISFPAHAQDAQTEAPANDAPAADAPANDAPANEDAAPRPEMTADTVVATVNGTEITLGHMIVLREGLPEQYKTLPDDMLFTGILDQLVQQTALSQTVETPPSVVTLSLENDRRAALAGAAVSELLETAITDEAIQAAYEEQFANAEPVREFNASHILVETREEAEALIAELEGGADFATVAEENSTGPSGPNGGELGWFGPGMMVEPFETAVTGMEPGDISEPVQTQFGWHVIRLNETRMQDAPSIDEVRPQIEESLRTAAVEAAVAQLVEDAEVTRLSDSEIDTSAVSNTGLLQE